MSWGGFLLKMDDFTGLLKNFGQARQITLKNSNLAESLAASVHLSFNI